MNNDELFEKISIMMQEIKAEIKSEIKKEFEQFKSEIKAENEQFRAEMRDEFEKFKSEMREEFEQFKFEIETKMKRFKIEVDELISNKFFVFEQNYGNILQLSAEELTARHKKEDIQDQKIKELEHEIQVNSAYVYKHEEKINNLVIANNLKEIV